MTDIKFEAIQSKIFEAIENRIKASKITGNIDCEFELITSIAHLEFNNTPEREILGPSIALCAIMEKSTGLLFFFPLKKLLPELYEEGKVNENK